MALSSFVLVATAFASNANKEFKGNSSGNGNGNASGSDSSIVDTTGAASAPTASDIVKVAHGKKVSVDSSTVTWGAVEFTGGSILSGTAANTLSLVLSTSTWTGGEINSSTVNTAGLTIGTGGDDPKKINGGGKLKLGGTTTWNADPIGLAAAATLENSSGATFTTSFDGVVTNDGSAGGVINAGTFTKSNGAGGANATDIQTAFTNTGSVNATSGTLLLSGGGTSSAGTITVGSGAKLKTNGNNFDFTGGVLNSASDGAIEVAGATTTFSGTTGSANLTVSGTGTAKIGTTHSTTGKLTLSAGKLDGTSNTSTATVGGFDWTGGDVTTAVINSSGTTISSGSAKKIYGGAKLNLSGTTTQSDDLSTGGAAQISNAGTFTLSGGNITHGEGGTIATFKNNGSFAKSSSGTSQVDAYFDNTGTGASVAVNGGTLQLIGGGSSNKGVSIADASSLQLGTTDFTFSGGALNTTGTGAINLTSATTTFGGTTGSANLTVSGTSATAKINGSHSTSGKLTLSGGNVNGSSASDTATVGSLDWSTGNISSASVTTSGTTTISGTGAKKLSGGAKLNVGGTTTVSADLSTGGAAEINNTGTFTLSGANITHGEGGTIATFKNNGSFAKSNSGTSQVDAYFDNTGTGASVAVNAGTLQLTGGGNSNKGVSIADASSLQLGTTDFTFSGGALNTTGTGSIDLTSATTTFSGTTGSANLSVSGAGATAKINGSHATTGKLSLSGGSVSANAAGDTATVGSLDWTTGNVATATIATTGAVTISGAGAKKLSGGGKLSVGGTTTQTADLSTGGAAEINNTGTFTISSGNITHGEGGTIATFKNNGSFNKTNAGTTQVDAFFDNTGTGASVAVGGGTLQLTGGGTSNKGVGVADASTLQLGTTDFTFSGGALNTTGTGVINLTSATTTFGGTTGNANLAVSGSGATAKINGSHTTTGKLTLSGGKVNGSSATDTATVGSLDWTTGDITSATVTTSGTTTIGGIGAKKLNGGGKLAVGGTTTQTADLSTGGGAEINNTGTFTISSGNITHGEGGTIATFKNNGSFNKANAGTTQVDAFFDNTGTGASVAVGGGTLQLTGGGNSNKGVSVADASTLQLGTTDFTFSGGALNTTGTGLIDLAGATTTFGGTTGSANLSVSGAGATAKISGSHSTTGKLTLSGGKVNAVAAGDTASVGTFDWTTGDVTTATIATTGAVNISGLGAKKLNGGAKLSVGGTTTVSSDLSTGGAAEINNSGTFTISSGNITHGEGGTIATFKNNGGFNKTNTGTTQVDAFFDNTGSGASVSVGGGTLQLTGGGNSNKGVSVADASTLQLGTTDFTFSGGALNTTGTGAINLTSATTTFGGTTGSANLAVTGSGATAKINGSHSTTGKLTLSAGKVNGASASDTATVGSFDWTTGDVTSATIATSGTVNIGAGGAKKLNGGAKLNVGGATTVTSDLSTGGAAEINNTGTFTINSGNITHGEGGTIATFKNNGAFNKANGGTTQVDAFFDNTGTGASVAVGGGTLQLTGGGNSNKGVSVADASTLQLGTTDFTFSGGALNTTGTGIIDLTSATTTFGGTTGNANLSVSGAGATAKINGSHSTSGKLTLSGGSVNANAAGDTATVGSFDWTTGNVTTATISTTGAVTIGGAGAKKLTGGGKLNVGGTTTQTADLSTGGAAEINNTGTFTIQGGNITHGEGGTIATFKNNGSFNKANSGTTQVDAFFDNTGAGASVAIGGGTLQLTGGGNSNKGVSVADASTLQLGTTDFTFSGGALNTTGTGVINLTSATTTFGGTTGNANLAVTGAGATAKINGSHATSGKLTLSAGKVNGTSASDTATVGSFDWTTGDVTSATIATTGAVNIGAGGAKKLNGGAKLNVGGNTTQSADLSTGGAAEINNTGTFTIAGGDITHGEGGTIATFKNNGSFKKSNAGATSVDAFFDNTGASADLAVDAGTLKLTGGGHSNKGVSIADNSSLQLGTTDFTFSGGALNTTGAGLIDLTSATTTFGGTTGNANLSISGAGATAKINGSHSTSGKLSLTNGRVTANAAGDTASVGSLDWTTGEVTTATIATNGAVNINAGGAKKLNGGAKLNVGGATTQNADLSTGVGAEINNTGTFTLAAGNITHGEGGAIATFKNNGSFKKSNAGSNDIDASFENDGASSSVSVDAGTLRLVGGGHSSKGVNIGNGAKLQLTNSDYAFTGGSLDGDGTIDVNGAVTSFTGTSGSAKLSVTGGTARFTGNHNGSGKLTFSAGTIDGGGTATLGGVDWTAGDLSATTLNLTGASTITGIGTKRIKGAGHLKLGDTSWSGGTIDTGEDATIENGGSFTTNFDGVIANSLGGNRGTFKNTGTFNKSAGGEGATEIQTSFENSGTVNVNVGKLRLSGSGKNNKNAAINVANSAELDVASDLELLADSELKGNGLARLLSGTLTANGRISIKNFNFEAGALSGSNTFDGTVNWNGGDWNNSTAGATTTIDVGGILNLENGANHDYKNRSIINRGTVNWRSGNLRGGNGSQFVNEANATFNDLNEGNKSLQAPGTFGGSSSFTNNGSYKKTSSGSTTIEVPFTNNNELLVNSGILRFSDTFTQTAGTLFVAAGATAKFDQGLNFGAGTLGGGGTIDGNVTSSGKLSPGASPGVMTITGNLTLAAASVAFFEIGGNSQGSTYDFVNVNGAATLGGILQFGFVNNFQTTVLPNDKFTIVASAGLTGAFSNVANGGRIDSSNGFGSFQVNYGSGSIFDANSVVLSNFSAVPEPSTWALMLSGLGFVGYALRRKKK